jgi:putative ABC transport system ATP-binding protein
MAAPVSLLRVQALRYRWPGAAADTLDLPDTLALDPGEAVFLRGPSGCGKSTLLSLLAGVLVADAGEVALLGQDWRQLSPARRDRVRADHVGYIFQQFNLLPYLSVLDNVRLPCRFSTRRAAQAAADEAERLLAQLGLAATLWRRPAAQLSVGQQQRVACARALIGRPALVIADEPTSALDEALRDRFMTLLLDACRRAGSALVLVSHDARLAIHFGRRLDLPALNRATVAPQEAGA